MSGAPTCWIIAGPNVAGKTTFALKYLPEVAGCRHFINADAIAAGLSPLAPPLGTPSSSSAVERKLDRVALIVFNLATPDAELELGVPRELGAPDRKSTRLNSSHVAI